MSSLQILLNDNCNIEHGVIAPLLLLSITIQLLHVSAVGSTSPLLEHAAWSNHASRCGLSEVGFQMWVFFVQLWCTINVILKTNWVKAKRDGTLIRFRLSVVPISRLFPVSHLLGFGQGAHLTLPASPAYLTFASKYAFGSIFQALQDLHTFASLQTQHFSRWSAEKSSNSPKI